MSKIKCFNLFYKWVYNAYLLLEFQILLATLMHGGQHEAKGLVRIIALKMLKWVYICIVYLLHWWWLVSFLASIQQMAMISMYIWLNLAKWMMNYVSIWFQPCSKLKALGLNDSKFSTSFQMYVESTTNTNINLVKFSWAKNNVNWKILQVEFWIWIWPNVEWHFEYYVFINVVFHFLIFVELATWDLLYEL